MENDRDRKSLAGRLLDKVGSRTFASRVLDPDRRPLMVRRFLAVGAVLLILPKAAPSMIDAVRGAEADEGEEVVAVDAIVVEPRPLEETLRASGTIHALQEIELTAEVSGIVKDFRIDEGGRITAGDLLIKLNDNDLQAELRGVEYQLEVMEQAAERQKRLVEEGGTTREAYDRTLIQVNELLAARENLQARIERTEVRAPFDGLVGLSAVHMGSYITPSTRIATLQDVSSVRLDFAVPERYASRVVPGSEIRFTIQGNDSVFTGTVSAVEPRIDPRTRTLRVRATSDNEAGLLKPGSFARIELVVSTTEGALMVPSIAILPGLEGNRVFVHRDGRAVERTVRTGTRTAGEVQIIDGLEPDDTVIVNGLHRLANGTAVVIRTVEEGKGKGTGEDEGGMESVGPAEDENAVDDEGAGERP